MTDAQTLQSRYQVYRDNPQLAATVAGGLAPPTEPETIVLHPAQARALFLEAGKLPEVGNRRVCRIEVLVE